jgi:hypothetical protein
LRRKRIESPMPIRADTRSSFARPTTPGIPTRIGRWMPRAQTSSIQAAVTLGSKHTWLVM